ncbi:hypothetical protein TKK_0017957 [Trichogramma kaykai]
MMEISNENQSLEEEDESSSYAENDPEDSDEDTDNSELTTYSILSFDLDGKTYGSEIDEKLIEAFQEGRNKLVKHYQKFNWLYCVSLILDPRIKISGFDETSWGQEMKHNALKKFKSIYKNYYDRFSTTDCEEPVPKKLKIDEEDSLDFDILLKSSTSSISEKELNNYLESPRPEPDTNILIWWKTYANVYPIIARIARDVLRIPATSVPVERLFSEASLVLTKNRCSLNSQDLRELICINRWMHSDQRNKICEINL